MSGIGAFMDRLRDLIRPRAAIVESPSFGYADLRGGGSRLAIILQLGGRISALELGGREWLVSTPKHTPIAEDAAGFGECFPTAAACTIPNSVPGFGGTTLPEGGELLWQRPGFGIRTESGPVATTTWTGERLPYELTRVARVASDGAVSLQYRAVNLGKDPMPFVWFAQPVFPLTPRTRVVLPEGAMARVGAQHGIDLGAGAREQRWPKLRTNDRVIDMSRPDGVSMRFACKLFFAMPREPVAIEEDGLRLEILAEAQQVPNLGLWINRGGWSPDKRSSAPRTVSLQPCIGAPDSLAEALGEWKSVHWLAPNEAREWSLTFRARPRTSDDSAARQTPAGSRPQVR